VTGSSTFVSFQMHKWTTTTSVPSAADADGRPNVYGIALKRVVERRGGPLNEVEAWAVLSQAGQALQDALLGANAEGGRVEAAAVRQVACTPTRLFCLPAGKVMINANGSSDGDLARYLPLPVLSRLQRRAELTEAELERAGIFSLGRTVAESLADAPTVSESLNGLLREMTSSAETATLLSLMKTTSEEWRLKVGSSPVSRFISQLYRVTSSWEQDRRGQGVTSSLSSASLVARDRESERRGRRRAEEVRSRWLAHRQLCLPPPPLAVEERLSPTVAREEAVEFSRLDASSASSASEECSAASPSSGGGAAERLAESPEFTNNNVEDKKIRMAGLPQPFSLIQSAEQASPASHRTRPKTNEATAAAAEEEDLGEEGDGEGVYENVCFKEGSLAAAGAAAASAGVVHKPPFAADSQPPTRSQLALLSEGSTKGESTPLSSSSSSSRHARLTAVGNERRRTTAAIEVEPSKRNPSRLYRVVKPLTSVTPMLSPATKRCVGPEFVVMAAASRNDPLIVDLTLGSAGAVIRDVEVEALSGHLVVARVSPSVITAGQVLDAVLSALDVKEARFYCLALAESGMPGGEFWPLENDCRLSRVSPAGWRDNRASVPTVRALRLHLRLRFVRADAPLEAFRDLGNKHQMYLQLRRDVVAGRLRLAGGSGRYLAMASLALQTEFGDYSDDIHGADGSYFILEHYLPSAAVREIGGEVTARAALARLHRARRGHGQGQSELDFCREAARASAGVDFGCHLFSVRETKKPSPHNLAARHLGIHLGGVRLFETSAAGMSQHHLVASFAWRSLARIQYDKCRFQLSVMDNGDTDSAPRTGKLKFYVAEEKAKLMFDLASAHHRHHMQTRARSDRHEGEEQGVGLEYREPRSERAIRSLKNRFLSRRQLTQRRLYTTARRASVGSSADRAAGKEASGMATCKRSSSRLMVKRLTHYASMADAAAQQDALNCSDKENHTPGRPNPAANVVQNYR